MPALIAYQSTARPVPERTAVHRRGDGALVAGLRVFLEEDDLGVLAAELDHRAHVRVQVIDGHRDRVHLLHEAGAGRPAQRTRSPIR